jgi:hypothetical protein
MIEASAPSQRQLHRVRDIRSSIALKVIAGYWTDPGMTPMLV